MKMLPCVNYTEAETWLLGACKLGGIRGNVYSRPVYSNGCLGVAIQNEYSFWLSSGGA